MAASEVIAPGQPGMMGQFAKQTLFKTLATLGQYLLPFAFLMGAALSAYGQHKRKALHQYVASSPSSSALTDMSWQEFEALVGEAFRQKGYVVTETGGGGADGGKAYKVGVSTVRELYGVMAAKGATGSFVVTSGVFTDEASAFAAGRNIELIDGKVLHALIRGVNVPDKAASASPASVTAPACPVCQSAMLKRKARKGANAGNEFWGCSRYPACKGTRPV
jgi:restriction system protein